MTEIYISSNKKIYVQPSVELIVVDNEISLVLDSLSDPGDEPITLLKQLDSNNPYKISV